MAERTLDRVEDGPGKRPAQPGEHRTSKGGQGHGDASGHLPTTLGLGPGLSL